MAWTGAHYAFAVEMFFKTGESITATVFLYSFLVRKNDAVLDRKSILELIENPIQNSIILTEQEMSTKSFLCSTFQVYTPEID